MLIYKYLTPFSRATFSKYNSWDNENQPKNEAKNNKRDHFVSDYAMTNSYEDAADTFAYFVMLDDEYFEEIEEIRYNGDMEIRTGDEKLMLFYKDSKMQEIRAAIRENLKKKNLLPKISDWPVDFKIAPIPN